MKCDLCERGIPLKGENHMQGNNYIGICLEAKPKKPKQPIDWNKIEKEILRKTEEERDNPKAWFELICLIAEELNCLPSCYPSGNEHLIETIRSLKQKKFQLLDYVHHKANCSYNGTYVADFNVKRTCNCGLAKLTE